MVRKQAGDQRSWERLQRQAAKQRAFHADHPDALITAPEVLAVDPPAIVMDFVRGTSLGEFLQQASVRQSSAVCTDLSAFLSGQLQCCPSGPAVEALVGKLDSLDLDHPRIRGVPGVGALAEAIRRAFRAQPRLPVGSGHGDFSFDNILVEQHTGRIYLIDFLDMPLESPVLDVARLYLDAAYPWWGSYGRTRHRLLGASRDLAHGLRTVLAAGGVTERTFRAVLALTILRILPYTGSPIRRGVLCSALHDITAELSTSETSCPAP
ncbi:MAG: phosphotransferase [Kineosporiaceae bacterium]